MLEKLPSLSEVSSHIPVSRDDIIPHLPVISAAAAATVSLGTYLYVREKHNYWRKRGVKGPAPSFPLGNAKFTDRPVNLYMMDWQKEYGNVYGLYRALNPVLVLADAEMVKEALIKNFPKFRDRRIISTQGASSRSLIDQNGEHWKHDRSIMSQTFSSGKMKQMYPLMREAYTCLDRELQKIVDKGEQVDIKTVFAKMSTMVIARCAFATEVDAFADPDHELLKRLQGFFKIDKKRVIAHLLLPERVKKWIKFSVIDPSSTGYIASVCLKILNFRRTEQNRANNYTDLLQLLMDTNGKENKGFSDSKIIANSVLFFNAGYETTSTLLTWASYALALNPHVQETLHQEVIQAKNEKGEFDYETLFDLKYLDAVINETLRLYPPVPMYDRVCTQDHTFENGIRIDAGRTVRIHAFSLGRNPDYWTNPEAFDPLRFMPENKDSIVAGSFVPFVIGPRNCIGMRFALLEAKMTLAEMMCKYKFVPSEDTPAQPDFSSSFILSMNNYKVKIEKRD